MHDRVAYSVLGEARTGFVGQIVDARTDEGEGHLIALIHREQGGGEDVRVVCELQQVPPPPEPAWLIRPPVR